MKKAVFVLVFLLMSVNAFAMVTCNTFGSMTTCSGTDNNGNYGSTTCNTFGSMTTCS